jgi:hypothetical protein
MAPLLLEDLASLIAARRKAVAAGILLAGFAAGLLIYFTATPSDLLGERPEDSKRYLRQMEIYGGKANILASEIRERFAGLWHGRALAFTVAGLSVLLALAVFAALSPLPPTVDPGGTVRGDPSKPDS